MIASTGVGTIYFALLALTIFNVAALFVWLFVTGVLKTSLGSSASNVTSDPNVRADNIIISGDSTRGNVTFTVFVNPDIVVDADIRPQIQVVLPAPPPSFKAAVIGNTVNGQLSSGTVPYEIVSSTSNSFIFMPVPAVTNGDVHIVSYIVA